MTKGKLNSFLLFVAPPLVALLMRVWFKTCKVTVHNEEYLFQSEDKNIKVVASFWHYSLLYMLYFVRNYSATVMVSASRDGDYIARLANQFGFSSVRGSRNKRGVQALKGLLKAIHAGDSCAVVADGSQGPARIAQPGALLLGAKTGVPIVPMIWSASSYFTIRSWDRTAIPKPFSKIDFFYGEPLHLPAKIKSDELEEYRLLLEKRLNDLYNMAWQKHGRQAH